MAGKRRPSRHKNQTGRRRPANPSGAKRTKASPAKARARTDGGTPDFPIVGIGASAGGLAALERFFDAVPSDSHVAFVVVTHQMPGHSGLLRDLLKKHTALRMVEAADGMRVEPRSVYLSVAGMNLSILNGKFYVIEPENTPLHLPIDFFFRSLVQDRKESAIGIVLSGAGSDGTVGLRTIKNAGGCTLVQDPEEAEYNGMPRSAIAAQAADAVLPVGAMPARLKTYIESPRQQYFQQQQQQQDFSHILPKFLAVLRDRTGHDFSTYKQKTLLRRLERRMMLYGMDAPDYLRLLQTDAREAESLFQEFLIGVTSFFRDPEAYEAVAKNLARLLSGKPAGSTLRLWVPACATGEEAYSIAITLREQIAKRKRNFSVQLFATDLDQKAIETARAGVYPAGIADEVSPARLKRFFTKEDGHYRVKKDLRNQMIFAVHNFLSDPPFGRLDLVSCRNVLIYLEAQTQRRVLTLFHYALKPNGLLLLGSSEVITSCEDLYEVVDRKAKLFKRRARQEEEEEEEEEGYSLMHLSALHTRRPQKRRPAGPPARPARAVPAAKRADLIETFLLDQYAPASVVVNQHGEIVHVQGHTGPYLEPPPGAPTRNLVDMTRKGLRLHVEALLHQAVRQQVDRVSRRGLVQLDGDEFPVDVTVKRIDRPHELRGLYLVTFEKTADPAASDHKADAVKVRKGRNGRTPTPPGKLLELREELQQTRHRLQQSIEDLETSNEEFKAANEELQSTNEELQSTNEELETAKEELHSLNEELVTLNAELQGKIDELSISSDDMAHLFESTDAATIFLDSNLHIRRFTHAATKLFNLLPTDIGRPLTDMGSKLVADTLIQDSREVLRTLIPRETELRAANGKWYYARVLPFRTIKNVIAGVVLAFLDISHQKHAEERVQQARAYAESIVETVREPLLVLDEDLRISSANQAFYRTFQLRQQEVAGQLIYHLHDGQWNIPKLRQLLEEILPKNRAFEGFLLEHDFGTIGRRTLMLNARRLEQEPGHPARILVAIEDVTERPARPEGKAGTLPH